ncbi:23S RIBOSOMAL RNA METHYLTRANSFERASE [Plesiocystis pacifica SIR-1]|uniref:23S RIBOSOMAL RNA METHYLTRANSFERASE n=1 Tax=Plesiocystis pacifica SIR-1 TaxID=391625 RepID=A6G3V8_9BACT|nr:RNA methyltransferase [Plesiocystis pacifica]EDM79495.1 23S RIBOSOMAL RNA METHYLTRANSFERASE [Plesiocystis pacifica SIR-1]
MADAPPASASGGLIHLGEGLDELKGLDDPRLEPFRALRGRREDGRFIVEGALAVERLLEQAERFPVESLVCTPSHGARLEAALPPGVPAFVLPRKRIAELAGFDFHRGVLACARRPPTRAVLEPWEIEALRRREQVTVVVASGLADPRNLGALIRNAAAFGVDWVVVDGRGADAFARLTIRASVGNVFRVPLLVSEALPATVEQLRRELPATVVAATPAGELELDALAVDRPARQIVLVGNEGAGLDEDALARADRRVRIPVVAGADSVNVAAATAILLYALRPRGL